MAHLDLTYFGTFQATLDGERVKNFRGAKNQGLLIFLSLHPDEVFSRDYLATLFWPERCDRALNNLKNAIYQLRKALPCADDDAHFVQANREDVWFNPDSDHRLDVTLFQYAIQQEEWASALVHYHDDLLLGFSCKSEAYEEWLTKKRRALQEQALNAMSMVAEEQITREEFEQAESTARDQLALIAWHEPAHRQLMHALAAQGKRVEALAQYEFCSRLLMQELGITPSPEMDLLYDRINAGELDPPSKPLPPTSPSPTNTENKPQSTPFQAKAVPDYYIGRNGPISELTDQLANSHKSGGGTLVAALVGMGGAGKTTLAAHIATELRDDFADGVLWANTTTSSAYDILELWGRAYGHDFSGLSDLESRSTAVRGMLAERSTLIILDNVEDAAHVRPLLPNSPNCACLMTTRNLDVAATINAHSATVGELPAESGLQLLTAIVGEARVRADLDAAMEICRLLHNLPLAVEIAAQLLKARSRRRLSSMAERLQTARHRLDLNISDLAVRTSFTVSWDALDAEQQRIFALLAVFEGRPFSIEAIAYLADSDPIDVEEELYTLASLSLLTDEDDQYFRQHPLLADFALEQLVQKDEAYARMVDYYLRFAEENKDAYETLEKEWGNLNAAIEVAHRLKKWEQVIAFADLLEQPWQTRGRYRDARSAYRFANAAAEQIGSDELLARVLLNWGVACVEQGDYEEADKLLTKSLRLAYDFEEGEPIADAQYHLGRVAMERGEYERSRKSLDECIEIRRELADPLKLAEAYYMQGWWYYENGFQVDKAERLGIKALEIQKEHGRPIDRLPTLQLLAQVAAMQANLDSALEFAVEAKLLCEENNDIAELAATLYVFTQIYRLRNEYTNANKVGQLSVKLLRYLGLKRIEGMTLHQLGVMDHELGNNDLALELSTKSAEIFRQIDDRLNYVYSLSLLGGIYHRQNELDKSKELWTEAVEIAANLNNEELQISLQLRLDKLDT